jgi:precorrin-6B methylase 2
MSGLEDLLGRLSGPSHALAALAAAIDARASGRAVEPAVAAVVTALGATDVLESAAPAELRMLLADIRAFALTDVELVMGEHRHGWTHDSRRLLETTGEVSRHFAAVLEAAIAPQLDGLALNAPGAAFLDVGVGVAAMALELARRWPSLRIVGIDPWEPALAIARERVRAAGLEERIELRAQAGEALEDRDRFDLGWIPTLFISAQAIEQVVRNVHRAVKPGGWVLVPIAPVVADPLAAALVRLRIALFGGSLLTPSETERLLHAHGFHEVRSLPLPPGAPMSLYAARR